MLSVTRWSADGAPGWSADGFDNWSADGACQTPPVPDVIGLALALGETWITDAGFVVGAVIKVADDAPLGTIVAYSPSGPVAGGASITLYVSGLSLSGAGAAYAARITSEHNQLPKFMALVAVYTDAMAEIAQGTLAIGPAFDLDVAIGAQLDILGLWVGQSRVLPFALNLGYFGFADDLAALPFGEYGDPSKGGIWFEQGGTASNSVTLGDAAYRSLIRARIARNQSNGTLAVLESALTNIFGVPCRVIDQGTKVLAITVVGPINATGQALLSSLDLLPRPAGVRIGSLTFTT